MRALRISRLALFVLAVAGVVAPAAPAWSQVSQASPAPVRLEPPVVDFGDVTPFGQHEATLRVVNEGTEPVTLGGFKTFCACTTLEDLSGTVLAPGESAETTVVFDSGNYRGEVGRLLMLGVAGYDPVQIRTRANVNDGIRHEAEFDPPAQYHTGYATLTSVDGTPFRVLSVNDEEPVFADAEGEDRAEEARVTHRLRFDFTGTPEEELPVWLVVETDHPTAPVVDVTMKNPNYYVERKRREWTWSYSRRVLQYVPPGETTRFTMTMRGFRPQPEDQIQDLRVESDKVDVHIMGIEATAYGLEITFGVRPREGASGVVNAPVTVRAKDHEETFRVMGRIAEPPAKKAEKAAQ